MKIDAEITILVAVPNGKPFENHVTVPVDVDYVEADEDSIYEYVAESKELYQAFGYTPNTSEFEIDNVDGIVKDMAARAPTDSADCNMKKKIADILRRYFDYDDNGDPNPEFDKTYTAQNAIDDIHDIIGDI